MVKTIGHDRIHYEFLQQLPNLSLKYLLQIYSEIWLGGNVSNLWKRTTVIPIPTHENNQSEPQNPNPLNNQMVEHYKFVSRDYQRLCKGVLNKEKTSIHPLFNQFDVLSRLADKVEQFTLKFYSNSTFDASGVPLLDFPLRIKYLLCPCFCCHLQT